MRPRLVRACDVCSQRPHVRSQYLSPSHRPVRPFELQSATATSSAALTDFLVPTADAIIRIGGEKAEVATTRWSASFEGVLTQDILQVSTGTVSPRLEALARVNAAAAAVASWSTHRWLPLTALDAVRLDGFDTLFIEVVGICNEKCLHCYAESGPTVESSLSRETCEAILEDAQALGFRRVQFTGGDPLLCSFLPELLARAQCFETREIYTNGLALTEELLEKLAPYNPSFAFSYYSNDPQIHDAITRTPGSHRRTRSAIARAVAHKLPVRAAMVVFNENVDTVDATVNELTELGVGFVSTSASKSAGRGSQFAWQPRNTSTASTTSNAGHRSADMRSEGKLCVTYEGTVVPCIFNRSRVLGTLSATHRLRDVIETLAVTPGPAASAEKLSCGSCRLTDQALVRLRNP
jgi:MoaA/NifB/PqqE/SkfB family radical SAM enzyme